eukprot:33496-Eustigmatos_ZCMA.PRE.1
MSHSVSSMCGTIGPGGKGPPAAGGCRAAGPGRHGYMPGQMQWPHMALPYMVPCASPIYDDVTERSVRRDC